MKNGKFIKMIFQMQNIKRWNDYAPHFKDVTASHSFRTAAIAVILSIAEEKLFNNKIDKFKVVGGSLFHDLNENFTSSIKHVTKKERDLSQHIKAFEKMASESIVQDCFSDNLQPFFRDIIVNAEDDTYEGRMVDEIDSFDAFLFCHREMLYGSNPHFRVYFESLKKRLQNSEVKSIVWLLKEFEKNSGIYRFLNHILMLDTVERWSDKFNMVPDNDATHTFRVTSLALFVTLFEEKHLHKKRTDWFLLLGKCLFHDLVEQKTGDTLGPVKHSGNEIKMAFERYEKKTAMHMIEELPEFLREDMIEMMVECKNETPEGDLVDIADKIDAFFKSAMEMDINPKSYKATYRGQYKKIKKRYKNRKSVMVLVAYMFRDIRQFKLRSHWKFITCVPILYLKKEL